MDIKIVISEMLAEASKHEQIAKALRHTAAVLDAQMRVIETRKAALAAHAELEKLANASLREFIGIAADGSFHRTAEAVTPPSPPPDAGPSEG